MASGGCSSGVVRENNIVGSELSECRPTHTLFEYPLGKPLEVKLLKELYGIMAPDPEHRFSGQNDKLSRENEPQFLTTEFLKIRRPLYARRRRPPCWEQSFTRVVSLGSHHDRFALPCFARHKVNLNFHEVLHTRIVYCMSSARVLQMLGLGTGRGSTGSTPLPG